MNTANEITEMLEELLLVDLDECLFDPLMCVKDLRYIKQQIFESNGIDIKTLSKEDKGEG